MGCSDTIHAFWHKRISYEHLEKYYSDMEWDIIAKKKAQAQLTPQKATLGQVPGWKTVAPCPCPLALQEGCGKNVCQQTSAYYSLILGGKIIKFSEFAAFSYKPAHKFTLKLSYSKEIVFYKN